MTLLESVVSVTKIENSFVNKLRGAMMDRALLLLEWFQCNGHGPVFNQPIDQGEKLWRRRQQDIFWWERKQSVWI